MVDYGNEVFGRKASMLGIKTVTHPVSVPGNAILFQKEVSNSNEFRSLLAVPFPEQSKSEQTIRMGPNPASQIVQIYFNGNVKRGEVVIKVLNENGTVVLSKKTNIDAGAKIDVNVSTLVIGQYYLIIQKNQELLFSKPFQIMRS